MKSDCCGAELSTVKLNLTPFDGICSACGAACFAVTEECHPAAPREFRSTEEFEAHYYPEARKAKEDHPGRWPVKTRQLQYNWLKSDCLFRKFCDAYQLQKDDEQCLSDARDYILHLEARAENAEGAAKMMQELYTAQQRRAEAAEKECDELREHHQKCINAWRVAEEQNAELLAKLRRAEKERDKMRELVKELEGKK